MVWGGGRKDKRVGFQSGIKVLMVAADGSWQRSCFLEDISDSGARLTVDKSIEGLNLKEFFLQVSFVGLAYRRCQLVRVNGNEIGVQFLTTTCHPQGESQRRTQRAAQRLLS